MLPVRFVEYIISVAVVVGPVLLTVAILDRIFKD
jgi:hypothetical protein